MAQSERVISFDNWDIPGQNGISHTDNSMLASGELGFLLIIFANS